MRETRIKTDLVLSIECIPGPKILLRWSLNPWGDHISRWGLWEVMGFRWGLRKEPPWGDWCPYRKRTRPEPSPSPCEGPARKQVAVCKPGTGPSAGPSCAGILTSGSPAPRPVRNKCLSFKPPYLPKTPGIGQSDTEIKLPPMSWVAIGFHLLHWEDAVVDPGVWTAPSEL